MIEVPHLTNHSQAGQTEVFERPCLADGVQEGIQEQGNVRGKESGPGTGSMWKEMKCY